MLILPNDAAPASEPLADCILRAHAGAPGDIILALAGGVPALARRLAAGRMPGDPATPVGRNESGDAQKALDLGAHDHMIAVLRDAGVRQVLSEEAEEVIRLDPGGAFDVAIDPIDGSGSIGIGAPLGLLFAILPASDRGFLRAGRAAVAAGYAAFGHSTDFGFSFGDGVTIATHDPHAGLFRIVQEDQRIAPVTCSVAYNASNERYWPEGLQRYVRDLRAGAEGPRGKDFNMRWLAAAVGELHRILLQGGAFLYPADRRTGYEHGRLRLIYEAIPIAFLIEAAGGQATDGTGPILDRVPKAHHEHTPLIFGAAEEVAAITRALSSPIKG